MSQESEPDPGGLRDLIVSSVVAKLAPEELPLVEALHGLDDEMALQQLTTRRSRREPLGFGVEPVGALLTPVLWVAVDQAVRRVVDSAAKRAGKAKPGWRLLPGRRRSLEPAGVPALSREQLQIVEQCVLEAAQQARLSQDRGARIADSVVRRLILAQPAGEQPDQAAGDGP
jgi:hypothetical protein